MKVSIECLGQAEHEKLQITIEGKNEDTVKDIATKIHMKLNELGLKPRIDVHEYILKCNYCGETYDLREKKCPNCGRKYFKVIEI